MWVNPSKRLVDRALYRWSTCHARADNTSAVTLLFDPPGVQRRGERSSAQQPNVDTVSFMPLYILLFVSSIAQFQATLLF